MKRWLPCLFLGACSSGVQVDIQIVDPCNQQAIETMDHLEIRARGDGLTDEDTSAAEVGAGSLEFAVPGLPADFHVVVAGYRGNDFGTPVGLGVSSPRDLGAADGKVSIRVPFALIDSFYKTTSLEAPEECTAMQVDRSGATATYIPQNGKVLIIGGVRNLGMGAFQYTRAVELYDPSTGKFEVVAELRVAGARRNHSATLLEDGRVLIVGGEGVNEGVEVPLKTTLIVDARDPRSVKVNDGTAPLIEARTGHRAVRMGNRVVIVGGRGGPGRESALASIEVFDVAQSTVVRLDDGVGGAAALVQPRLGHSATAFDAETILVAGGMNSQGEVPSLELIRLGANNAATITELPETTGVGAIHHAAIATTGNIKGILLSGGYGSIDDAEPNDGLPQNPRPEVELWTLSGNIVSRGCTGVLNVGRAQHAVVQSGGRFIFIGGVGATGQPLPDAELATLTSGASCFAQRPVAQTMSEPRGFHAVAPIERTGEILIVGGQQPEPTDLFGRTLSSTEIFSPFRVP